MQNTVHHPETIYDCKLNIGAIWSKLEFFTTERDGKQSLKRIDFRPNVSFVTINGQVFELEEIVKVFMDVNGL